jgi:histidinol-phosphate aminotransferase
MGPDFVRSTIRGMHGYTPGEQPGAGDRVVKLNTNENPYPPSPKVLQAIRGVDGDTLRRYPNPTADQFRAAAAKLLSISSDMILAGNGSDDILTIATRTFVPPGGSIAFPEPTYSLYPVLAQLEDARAISVQWEKDFELPIESLLATKANAIYLANPNAPTGTFVPPAKVAELAKKFDGLVLVDEAYADFADENCLTLVRDLANVVISRTLSKAYSLAALRFGYAVARPQVISEMMKVKDSYNTDGISIVAATAAIEDQEYARSTWDRIRSERKRLTGELTQIGWSVLPSRANFVLATVPGGRGKEMYLGLKQRGVLVRYFNLPGLTDKVRITVGRADENDALLAAIKDLANAEKDKYAGSHR